MRDFHVFIEQQGEQIYVGKITGSGSEDAVFSYAQEYLEHTLKGETMTLGLGRLSKSSIILCEQLRYKIYGEEMMQQFRKVRMDYQKTIDIIRKYRDSQP